MVVTGGEMCAVLDWVVMLAASTLRHVRSAPSDACAFAIP